MAVIIKRLKRSRMGEIESLHTEEQELEVARMREAVKHLRAGGTMCLADIDDLLALLDTLDVYEPPEAPVTAEATVVRTPRMGKR